MQEGASLSAAIANLEKSGRRQKVVRERCIELVRWCGKVKASAEARHLHAYLRRAGLDGTTFMSNLLLQMYGRCGDLRAAMAIFRVMPRRDSFSFSFLIAACVQTGHDLMALHLARDMAARGLTPNKHTFIPILAACANLRDLAQGYWTHRRILSSRFASVVAVRNALISMYGKCGSLHDAQAVFDGMPVRDVITWTALLTAYTQNGEGGQAVELFREMKEQGIRLDRVAFLSVIDACAGIASLETGREIHEQALGMGLEAHLSVRNALINMYGKCGNANDARVVFDSMTQKNVISWTSMIVALSQNGHYQEALDLFRRMEQGFTKPNKVTFLNIIITCANLRSLEYGREIHKRILSSEFRQDLVLRTALVDMYGRCGSLNDAQIIFNEMHEHDVVSWTAMIAACAQNNGAKDALSYFQDMKMQGIRPNGITVLSVLEACSSLASLEGGRMIHEFIITNGIELSVFLGTALVSMYSKCGNLEYARSVFDKMDERNLVTWNSVISAYAQNGQGKESLELYQDMYIEGIIPDRVTFLSVLNACSHSGLLDEGKEQFTSMIGDYGFVPLLEHYVCMIDLLGRAGFLEEAGDLITSMPMEPTAIAWNSLLVFCRIHDDHGLFADKCLHECSSCTLLSHIYSATGRWTTVATLRNSGE